MPDIDSRGVGYLPRTLFRHSDHVASARFTGTVDGNYMHPVPAGHALEITGFEWVLRSKNYDALGEALWNLQFHILFANATFQNHFPASTRMGLTNLLAKMDPLEALAWVDAMEYPELGEMKHVSGSYAPDLTILYPGGTDIHIAFSGGHPDVDLLLMLHLKVKATIHIG